MGIAVKITGGQPMYRVIERLFSRTADAKSYLKEMGVTLKSSQGDEASPKCFKHKGFTYILSHPLPEILDTSDDIELPDTDMVRDLRERNMGPKLSANRNSPGRSTPSPTTDDASPGAAAGFKSSRPSPSKSSSSNTVNLKQLCQKLKLDPSKARQKLRKKFGAQGGRYEWTPEEAVEIEKVLAG